jgi:hypothetical protein
MGTGTPKLDVSPLQSQSGKRWKDTFSDYSHSNVGTPKTPFSSRRFGNNSEKLSERDRFRDDTSSNHDSADDNQSVYSGLNGDSGKKKKPARQVDLRRVPGVDQIADGALAGYLKVIVDINRSSTMLSYRKDERLANPLNQYPRRTPVPSGMPSESNDSLPAGKSDSVLKLLFNSSDRSSTGIQEGGSGKRQSIKDKFNEMRKQQQSEEQFKVRMGFGLHAGWAIEGAVGSIYKVDATYLSPHVNMAARLETSSRQYKVPLLMSHFFYELLSETPQKKCRKLDVITVKGSEVPTAVYTYDCFQDQIFADVNASSNAPLTARTLNRFMSLAGLGMNHSNSGSRKLGGLPGHSSHQRRGSRVSSGSGASSPSSPCQPSPHKRRKSIESMVRSLSPSFSNANSSTVIEGERKESDSERSHDNGIVNREVELVGRPPSIISPAVLLTASNNSPSVPFEVNSQDDVPDVTPLSARSDDSVSPSPGPDREGSPVDGESKEVGAKPLNVSAKRKRRKRSIPVIVISLQSPVDEKPAGYSPGNIGNNPQEHVSQPGSTTVHASLSPVPFPNQSGSGFLPIIINEPSTSGQQLSQLHQQLVKQKGDDAEKSHVSSSSPRRTEVSRHFPAHRRSSEARKLPLPPLSTHHSPQARLLLGQVHRELRQVQREIDRRKSKSDSHNMHHQSSSLASEIKTRRSSLQSGIEPDRETVEEEIDFNAIEEYLKLLFPESEILIPPVSNDDYPEIFLKDTDLLQLKCHITEHFYDTFANGVNEYIKGNWLKAKHYLEDSNRLMEDCIVHFMKTPLYRREQNENNSSGNPETVIQMVNYCRNRSSLRRMSLLPSPASLSPSELTTPAASSGPSRLSLTLINASKRLSYSSVDNSDSLLYGDGPSQTLLDYMKQTNYICPADWKGYRPLTSK